MRSESSSNQGDLRCSFCKKPQRAAGKLLSSPSDYPRAYICDECVEVCMTIIEDDRLPDAEATRTAPEFDGPHPLLSHPLASDLMECIVRWVREESLGRPASEELGRVRAIAGRMLNGE